MIYTIHTIHTHTYEYIRIQADINSSQDTNTYIHIHIYTYTYIQIHTHMQPLKTGLDEGFTAGQVHLRPVGAAPSSQIISDAA